MSNDNDKDNDDNNVVVSSFWMDLFQSSEPSSWTDLEGVWQGMMNHLDRPNGSTTCTSTAATSSSCRWLLHFACRHGAHDSIVEFFLTKLPRHVLTDRDSTGRIPLHYVCCQPKERRRLFLLSSHPSVLTVILRALLKAAPETSVIRLYNNTIGDDDDDDGILPAILAHNHSASPTVVQTLLRCQLETQQGLHLTHQDLCHLQWNEASFLDHVAAALRTTAAVHNDNSCDCDCGFRRISLVDCRLSYQQWQVLQSALEERLLPASDPQNRPCCRDHGGGGSCLTDLRLCHLHIWHSTTVTTTATATTTNSNHDNTTATPTDTINCDDDVTLWQNILDHHKRTLQTVELPYFYALTADCINQMVARYLAHHQMPALQVLDIRRRGRHQTTPHSNNTRDTSITNNHHHNHHLHERIHRVHDDGEDRFQFVEALARALRSPLCRLQSLAIDSTTSQGFQWLMEKGFQANRSVVSFQVDTILFPDENDDDENGMDDTKKSRTTTTTTTITPQQLLRQVLLQTLTRNTALERIVGPRFLIHCRQIQLYLQLNRQYHRRDIGHWSPTLVAHILAKLKNDVIVTSTDDDNNNNHNIDTDNNNNNNHDGFYFPTHEPLPEHDPRSTMFYILQSRPDILMSKQ